MQRPSMNLSTDNIDVERPRQTSGCRVAGQIIRPGIPVCRQKHDIWPPCDEIFEMLSPAGYTSIDSFQI